MSEIDFDKKDSVIARFFIKAIQNNFKTEVEGRAIFDDREFVEIIVPGNRGTIVERPAKKEDQERWPREYAAFKAGQDVVESGTPIEQWPMISPAMIEELKHAHVRTVEALAGLSDSALTKCVPMGGTALREKARAWLEQAAGGAPLSALQAENDRLKADVETLRQTVQELATRAPEKAA